MFALLRKAVGGRAAAKVTRRARPEVEALDERVMPTSVPNLQGVTINLDGVYGGARQLQITSERDNGNGTGTFRGYCWDAYGYAYVYGTITLRQVAGVYPGTRIASPYDFGLSYFGRGASYYEGSETIQGGGDFTCYRVSHNPGAYSQFVGATRPSYWGYSGWDYEQASGAFFGGSYDAYHSDADAQARQPSPPAPLAGGSFDANYPYG
jgi:hypothetical protein